MKLIVKNKGKYCNETKIRYRRKKKYIIREEIPNIV